MTFGRKFLFLFAGFGIVFSVCDAFAQTGRVTTSPVGQITRTSPGQITRTSPGQVTLTPAGQATLSPAGQATTSAPGQATLSAPGMGTLTSPGQATLTSPGQATMTAPGQPTLSSPGMGTLTPAGQATTSAPGQATLTSPGQATLSAPGQTTTTSAGQATLTTPGQATLTTPGQATTSSVGSSVITSSQVVSSPVVSAQVITTPVVSSQAVTTPVTSSVKTTPIVSSQVTTTPVTSSVKTTPSTSSVTSNIRTSQVTTNIRTSKVSEIIITPYPHGPGFGIEVGGIDLGGLYSQLDSQIRLSEVTANALSGDLSSPNTSGSGSGSQGSNAGGQVSGGGSGSSSGAGSAGSSQGGASSGSGQGGSSSSGSSSMGSNSSVANLNASSGGSGSGKRGSFLELSSDTKGFTGSSGSGSSHFGGIDGKFSFAGGELSAMVGNMTGVDVNGFLNVGGVKGALNVGDIKGIDGNIGVNNDSLLDAGIKIGGIAGARIDAGADIKGISAGLSTGKISLGDLRGKLKFGGANFGLGVGDISGLDLDASMNIGGFNMTATTGDISLGKLDLGLGFELPSFGFDLGGLFDGLLGDFESKDGKSVTGRTKKNENEFVSKGIQKRSYSELANPSGNAFSFTSLPKIGLNSNKMAEKGSGEERNKAARAGSKGVSSATKGGNMFIQNQQSRNKSDWEDMKNTTENNILDGRLQENKGTKIRRSDQKTAYAALPLPSGSWNHQVTGKTSTNDISKSFMADQGSGAKQSSKVKDSDVRRVGIIKGNENITAKPAGQWAQLVDSSRSVSRMHALRMDGQNTQKSYASDSASVKAMNETLETAISMQDQSAVTAAEQKVNACLNARKDYEITKKEVLSDKAKCTTDTCRKTFDERLEDKKKAVDKACSGS